jgi:hypothetical protein
MQSQLQIAILHLGNKTAEVHVACPHVQSESRLFCHTVEAVLESSLIPHFPWKGVTGHVDVHVPEAWNEKPALAADYTRPARNLFRRGSDGDYPIPMNYDVHVRQPGSSLNINNRHIDDRNCFTGLNVGGPR